MALNLSNKKYEIANQAKTDFLAAMSHDLRTPMNAIIGLTEISKNYLNDKKELEKYIDKIDISAKYLLGLINDILDISAIENRKLTISKDSFSLKELVHEIIDMYTVNSGQTNILFSSNIETISFENLIGDYYRLKQIITNLLSNAFKFTNSGGKVELNLKEEVIDEKKILLSIEVSDTGIGIAKDIRDKIYNQFVQADSGTLRKFGGSGLGLSIVKNLVELMSGNIELESEVGVGSTFKINIPLDIDMNKTQLKTLDYKTYSKYKVIFIDHDINTCANTSKMLSKLSIVNKSFTNLNMAKNSIIQSINEKNPYNIIIISSQYLKKGSISLASEISTLFKDLPHYVILSDYDITYLKSYLDKNEIDYYLKKPIFLSSLLYILEEINKPKIKKKRYLKNDEQNLNLNVLLCEDNEINQLVGKKILETYGCSTTIAENGKIGVETYLSKADNFFDVILMDIRMPVMDGYDATKAIRNSNKSSSKTIPIFAMTANVMKQDIEKSYNIGMNGHIAKPIEKKLLHQILQNIHNEKYYK